MDDVQKARYDRVFDSYEGPDGDLTWDSFSAHIGALAALRGEAADSPAVTTLREGCGGTSC